MSRPVVGVKMGRKVTLEEFIERARAVHGDRYDYSKVVYKNNSTKVEVICAEHGSFFPKPINHIQNQSGCPACVGCKRTTAEDFIERARAVHGDRYDYSALNYAGVDSLVSIGCTDHGLFQQIAYDHTSGHGCKICGVEKCASANRRLLAEFIAKARAFHGDWFDYSRAAYINSTTLIEIICEAHGSFWQTPYNHANGSGCPACAREQTTSKGENELAQWVAGLGLQVSRNDRAALGSMEIDIFLPDLKIGIEYNGAYWHSDGKLPHPRIHEVKASKARDAGIRLITIWDFDWETRTDFVKRFLLHAFGLNPSPKINARACAVRWVEASIASEFYTRTHIQGAAWRTIVNYGLFSGDDLVACMSFSQGVSRRGMMGDTEWELARFATDRIVRGGAGKIFTAFVKNHSPQTVWSFSDRQHFSGGVYPALGFKEDGRLAADYRVLHEASGRIWHKSAWQRKYIPTRLNELGIDESFDPATDVRTEREMQKLARVLRIMDAGKIRWRWTT